MRAVVQRVSEARVRVDGAAVGEIGRGLLVLVGVQRGDQTQQACALAERLAHLRIFPDARGRMNLSALDLGLSMLVVSQFTLVADTQSGRRPSFVAAAPPEVAQPLYLALVAELGRLGLATATGSFGAPMQVELVNEGPVTFVLDLPPPGTES